MAEKFLLIPGTSGTKLLLDGQDLGWPALLTAEAWLGGVSTFERIMDLLGAGADDLVDLLSMEFGDPNRLPPTKTTLKNGSSIAPGQLLRAAYNQFLDFETFVYDWRSDIRDSASKLLAHLEANRPANGKWRILSHSQGGLLVVVAAKLLGMRAATPDTGAFGKLVSHVAFCGCPFAGTINAADALANGQNLGAGFSDQFRRIARTWPSLYQMLASWPGSYRNGAQTGTLLDDAAWVDSGLDLALLGRARETRKTYFKHPFVFFDDVALRLTMSVAHSTHEALEHTGGERRPVGAVQGDTLVPFDRTKAAVDDKGRQATFGIGTNGDTAVHFMLCNDPVAATEFVDFFRR